MYPEDEKLQSLYRIINMVNTKKGTGRSKKTIVKIEMEVYGPINIVSRALGRLAVCLSFAPIMFEGKIIDCDVDSEFESNPDQHE